MEEAFGVGGFHGLKDFVSFLVICVGNTFQCAKEVALLLFLIFSLPRTFVLCFRVLLRLVYDGVCLQMRLKHPVFLRSHNVFLCSSLFFFFCFLSFSNN